MSSSSYILSKRADSDDIPCQLMDNFAVGVQLLLAVIALSSLLIKRHREKPRRPFLIWCFDASKQAFGGAFVHGLNVIVSLIAGGHSKETGNPCVWYFLNVGIDTTIGVYFLFLFLRLSHRIINRFQLRDFESGYYGNPPKLIVWLKQTILFSSCLFMVKVCVIIIFTVFPWVEKVGKWILSPFKNPKSEVVFVMLIFPLIMNVIQFWLIDSVIKAKEHQLHADDDPKNDDLLGVFASSDDPNVILIHNDNTYDDDSDLDSNPIDSDQEKLILNSKSKKDQTRKTRQFGGDKYISVSVSSSGSVGSASGHPSPAIGIGTGVNREFIGGTGNRRNHRSNFIGDSIEEDMYDLDDVVVRKSLSDEEEENRRGRESKRIPRPRSIERRLDQSQGSRKSDEGNPGQRMSKSSSTPITSNFLAMDSGNDSNLVSESRGGHSRQHSKEYAKGGHSRGHSKDFSRDSSSHSRGHSRSHSKDINKYSP